MRTQVHFRSAFILAMVMAACIAGLTTARAVTIVRFNTVMGSFDVQLFTVQMPRMTTNFLNYVDAHRYDGSAIHRNSDIADVSGGPLRDFLIQGGGYTFTQNGNGLSPSSIPTFAAVADEPGGGVAGPSNIRGRLTMAKGGPNSTTSQWFINQGDNSFIDSPARSDGGYSAIGAVLGDGMAVVDAIGHLPVPADFGLSFFSPFDELPLRNYSSNSTQVQVANTVTVISVQQLNVAPGDFNRDGRVNSTDLGILQSHLGVVTSGALYSDGDIDTDGDVDQTDLALWTAANGALWIAGFTTPTATTYQLRFTSQTGKKYALQYKNGGGAWTTAPGQSNISGADTMTTITGNLGGLISSGNALLFRVALLP
ncbi:MAG: peptidylprolyl isomerase [Limisphaerales bacterium]